MEGLIETIKVVYDKRQKGIPIMGAKEEVADDFITDWDELLNSIGEKNVKQNKKD